MSSPCGGRWLAWPPRARLPAPWEWGARWSLQAGETVADMNIWAEGHRDRFVVMAVGGPAEDGELEVGSIDEEGNLVNVGKDDEGVE